MDKEKIRAYVQSHTRELMIYLVMSVLSLYILFVMKLQFWMKLVVVALLVFGTYEAIAKIQGRPSAMEGLQKGIQEAQRGQNQARRSMNKGFGPFKHKSF